MTQQRLVNFGTTADAAKVKSINRQLFAAQLLRSDGPLLIASAPDQLLVQPHGVVFDNGVVLIEDEVKTFTVTTGPSSADFTLQYRHVDDDIIGGAPATLELRSGLFETVQDGVALGWIRYPGGSVPIDGAMLFVADAGQVQGRGVVEALGSRHDVASITTARSSDVTETVSSAQLGLVVPAAPHQLTIDPLPSRLLPYSAGIVRVFSHQDGQEFTRVAASPSAQQYSLEPTTGVATFNVADDGKVVDVVDLTYGQGAVLSTNGASSTRYADAAYSFGLQVTPYRGVSVEYVVLDDYTVDVVEVLDADGSPGTIEVRKVEPSSPDGTISRLSVRLLAGRFSGRAGEVMTVRLRKTLGPDGQGMELRSRASTYDLPF